MSDQPTSSILQTCPRCRGTGSLGDIHCFTCEGKGKLTAEGLKMLNNFRLDLTCHHFYKKAGPVDPHRPHNCLNNWKCAKCGDVITIDSSD